VRQRVRGSAAAPVPHVPVIRWSTRRRMLLMMVMRWGSVGRWHIARRMVLLVVLIVRGSTPTATGTVPHCTAGVAPIATRMRTVVATVRTTPIVMLVYSHGHAAAPVLTSTVIILSRRRMRGIAVVRLGWNVCVPHARPIVLWLRIATVLLLLIWIAVLVRWPLLLLMLP
jgi:hypothetical protein